MKQNAAIQDSDTAVNFDMSKIRTFDQLCEFVDKYNSYCKREQFDTIKGLVSQFNDSDDNGVVRIFFMYESRISNMSNVHIGTMYFDRHGNRVKDK